MLINVGGRNIAGDIDFETVPNGGGEADPVFASHEGNSKGGEQIPVDSRFFKNQAQAEY